MKIYTKGGDKGMTSLLNGKRVSKYNLRIEAYGTVDELNSHLGLLRDEKVSEEIVQHIQIIQDRLFTIGSLLAAGTEKLKFKLPEIQTSDIEFIENQIDKMDESLPELRSFILPGGNPFVSYSHVCRSICRRAERKIVQLSEESEVDPLIIQYINRLSDYFFTLSRKLTQDFDVEEIKWEPNKS